MPYLLNANNSECNDEMLSPNTSIIITKVQISLVFHNKLPLNQNSKQ